MARLRRALRSIVVWWRSQPPTFYVETAEGMLRGDDSIRATPEEVADAIYELTGER